MWGELIRKWHVLEIFFFLSDLKVVRKCDFLPTGNDHSHLLHSIASFDEEVLHTVERYSIAVIISIVNRPVSISRVRILLRRL